MTTRASLFTLLLLIARSTIGQCPPYEPPPSMGCPNVVDFAPSVGISHRAAVLTDPAGQQQAVFDLNRGGVLASLTYLGQEYLWSGDTLGSQQPILSSGNYQPTLAGDQDNRGTPMLGVQCNSDLVWLTSGMTDYKKNLSGSSPAFSVIDGQLVFDMFMAPYTVTTYASFVPNPAAQGPAYYLKVEQAVSRQGSGTQTFVFDLSTAIAPQFSVAAQNPTTCVGGSASPCTIANTQRLIAGNYSDVSLTTGIAVAMLPRTAWVSETGALSVERESNSSRSLLHMKRYSWTSKSPAHDPLVYYVMVGPWANALSYANLGCTFSFSSVPAQNVSVEGDQRTVTVTTPAGCKWEVSTDVPFITPLAATVRTGSGSVTYDIEPSTVPYIRSGTVTLAGRQFVHSQPYYRSAKGDFNHDLTADLVWQSASTGTSQVWLMSGGQLSGQAALPGVSSSAWFIAGTDDFNGDKSSDLIWRNSTTFQTVVWLMNGTTYIGEAALPGVSSADWKIVATGDFNGDKHPDLVWRNLVTLQTVLWLMNGTVYAGQVTLPAVSSSEWSIQGVDDFNLDGHVDVVWRNLSTFHTVVWFFDDTTYLGESPLPTVWSGAWTLDAVGDLNGDARPDLVWRNTTYGQTNIWLLNDNRDVVGDVTLMPLSGTWRLAGPR